MHEHLRQGSEGVWRLGLHGVRLGREVFALLWAESQFGGLKILITAKALSEADLVAPGCTSLHFTSYTYELETNDEYISLSQISTPTLRVTRIHETAQGMRHMA